MIRAIIGNDTAEAHVRVPAHWQAIGAGSGHSCAIDALGYAFCWGNNDHYQLGDGTKAPHSDPRPVKWP